MTELASWNRPHEVDDQWGHVVYMFEVFRIFRFTCAWHNKRKRVCKVSRPIKFLEFLQLSLLQIFHAPDLFTRIFSFKVSNNWMNLSVWNHDKKIKWVSRSRILWKHFSWSECVTTSVSAQCKWFWFCSQLPVRVFIKPENILELWSSVGSHIDKQQNSWHHDAAGAALGFTSMGRCTIWLPCICAPEMLLANLKYSFEFDLTRSSWLCSQAEFMH